MNKIIAFLLVILCASSLADGMVIDKVYHPYVIANEREIEWRYMSSQTDNGNALVQRIGYGQSVSENIMLEAYVIAARDSSDDFDIQAYEVEARWMMTEQGQYWADWGMLFEFEKHKSFDDYEATIGLLVEKEFQKTSLTLNLFILREWGQTIDNEWESEFRLKYRYRYLPQLQPAIEVYSGEDFFAIGPAFMGIHRFEGQKQLKWEAGFISEISHSGKNHTLRLSIEYEF